MMVNSTIHVAILSVSILVSSLSWGGDCLTALSVAPVPVKPNHEFFDVHFDPYLGLSFAASAAEPKQVQRVEIETIETQQLSQELGYRVVFASEFSVGTRKEYAAAPFREMKLIDAESGKEINSTLSLNPQDENFRLTSLNFRSHEGFKLYGNKAEMLPIIDHDILLNTRVGDLNLATHLFYRGDFALQSADAKETETIARVIEQGFKNSEDPVIQQKAVSVVLQGREAIDQALKKYGFKVGRTLYEGNVPQKQWAHEMGQKELADQGLEIDAYPIPVEHGDFAIAHGEYSHQAKLIAFFDGINPSDVKVFVEALMQRQRSSNPADWYAWVMLFDADNPKSPVCPCYWHRLIEEGAVLGLVGNLANKTIP